MPSTASGRFALEAISPIGSDEVLEANTTPLPTTSSTCSNRDCFRSRLSKTASITRSTLDSPSNAVLPVTLFMICSPSKARSCLRFTCLAICSLTWARARPTPASSTSLIRTVLPAFSALTVAMPAPISPPPRTATLLTGLGSVLVEMPVVYFIICEAKNRPRSAADSGDTTS